MVDITRRGLVKGGIALAAGGLALPQFSTSVVNATMAPGVARTLGVEPPAFNPLPSSEVRLERADDPADGDREDVVHVTSSGKETTHYAFSLVNVAKRNLTVDEISELKYDYFVPDPEANTVGNQKSRVEGRASLAPDEIWFVLQVRGKGREHVFRTWPIQEKFQREADEWLTRDVYGEDESILLQNNEQTNGDGDETGELTNLDRSPWKRLDKKDRTFEVIGPDLLEAYGDARILGVGFGRGDPFMGPSKLNIFYDKFVLNGTSYNFPV